MLDQMDFVYQAMLEDGVIDRHALDRASQYAADHRVSVTEALVLQGATTRQAITIARGLISTCPFVDLARYELDAARLGSLMPRAICEKNQAFPLFCVGGRVTVGMADPSDLPAIDRVRRALGREIDAVICEPRALRDLIARAHATNSDALEKQDLPHAPTIAEPPAPEASPAPEATPAVPAPAAPATPPPKPARARTRSIPASPTPSPIAPPSETTLEQFLAAAVEEGATEVHFQADPRGLRVRARIDGHLTDRACTIAANVALERLGALAGAAFETASGRARAFSLGGTEATVGVVTIEDGWTATVVLRAGTHGRSLAELGYSADAMTRLGAILSGAPGVVLVAGGAGSGRTTTLHAVLRGLDTSSLNIVGVCEPAPAGVRCVGSVASARMLRPDVLVIDPIRDEGAARVAIEASLAGVLVLGSLDAPTAADAAIRFRELSGWSDSASAMLRGVVCSRLVRKVCGACARVEPPTPAQRRGLGLADHENSFVTGAGCPKCRSTGTRGVAPTFELMEFTRELAGAMARGCDATTLGELALERGMTPMWRHGLDMARLGVTSLRQLERLAPEPAPAPLALRRSA